MRAQGSRDRPNVLRRCQSGDGGVGWVSVRECQSTGMGRSTSGWLLPLFPRRSGWLSPHLCSLRLALSQVGPLWRGEQTRQWPDWWARSLPAWIAVGWLMILALPVELLVMSRPEPVSTWWVLILGAVLLVVAAAIVPAAAVTLTGHPRRI